MRRVIVLLSFALLVGCPAQAEPTATVGYGPLGIAFDGTHMWVSASGSDTVTKIRAIYKTMLPLILKDF